MRDLQETKRLINRASKEGWDVLRDELETNANREIVSVDFEVMYDRLGHDIILRAKVKVEAPEAYLLQVWLKDMASGFWIPELQPWVSGVVEFDASQKVGSALCGLIDSKWRPEDSGQKYYALLWGYVEKEGEPVQFGPFEKEFVYPEEGA